MAAPPSRSAPLVQGQRRDGRVVERLAARGASAQAAIAGAYAWAVTVAPTVGEHGEPIVTMVAAGAGLAALLVAAAGERLWGGRGRVAALWVFVVASALAWLSAPAALRPMRLDAPRGIAGMVGWALFALACAGPALGDRQQQARVVDDAPLEPRNRSARGDAAYPIAGGAVALALQCVGWRVASPERALLVRLVALAAGLAVIGAATELALARHAPRAARSGRARLRSASASLLLLGGLAIAGLLLATRD
jgi:hypothetical protein